MKSFTFAISLCALFTSGTIIKYVGGDYDDELNHKGKAIYAFNFNLRSADVAASVHLYCSIFFLKPNPNADNVFWFRSVFVGKKKPWSTKITGGLSQPSCSRYKVSFFAGSNSSRAYYNLHISNLEPADEGNYTCVIQARDGGILELEKFSLKINDRSKQMDVPEPLPKKIYFGCSEENEARIIQLISWKRELRRQVAPYKEKYDIAQQFLSIMQGIYELSDVSREDISVITCYTEPVSRPTFYKRKIVLNFLYKPEIFVKSPIARIQPNETITLECMVDAFPWPRIELLHRRNPLSKPKLAEEPLSEEKYVIHFTRAIFHVKNANVGEYLCAANNSEGRDDVVVLKVKYKWRSLPDLNDQD